MASAIRSVLQLGALVLYIYFVLRLNGSRPKSAHYRPFKLNWMRNLIVLAVILFVLSFISLPHLFQPSSISTAVAKHQGLCRDFIAANDFKGAYSAIRDRSFVKKAVEEYGKKNAEEVKASLSETLSPVFNQILFNTGVAFSVVPALLKLLILMWQAKKENASKEEKKELNYQWGILLPVINHITLLSALTTFTFFFVIDDWRNERCIYTSGHWYTFTANVMTFALIIGHLYSYIAECKYSRELLLYYIGYFILYLGLGVNVLRNTQRFYHDQTEANDGIRLGSISFLLFMIPVLALQYILYLFDQYQTDSRKKTQKVSKDKDSKKKSAQGVAASAAINEILSVASSATVSSSDIPPAPGGPSSPSIPIPSAPVLDMPSAPQAPPAPEAPEAPAAPSAPSEQTLTHRHTADSNKSSSVTGVDLASQLGTVKLRKASASSSTVPAAASTSSGGLPFAASDLANRKSALKKIDVEEEKRKNFGKNSSGDPLQAVIQSRALQLRRFVQPEVKSDSDDEFSD